jgi:E3 ubiquitin-protein ligase DOA10
VRGRVPIRIIYFSSDSELHRCKEDTKGQTCYICTEAVHARTGEGLVRGCACRGTAGVAHVSCLVEQVKILVDEAVDNNLEARR